MRRLFFKMLAGTMALLTLLIVAAWVDSHWHRRTLDGRLDDVSSLHQRKRYWGIVSDTGELFVQRSIDVEGDPDDTFAVFGAGLLNHQWRGGCWPATGDPCTQYWYWILNTYDRRGGSLGFRYVNQWEMWDDNRRGTTSHYVVITFPYWSAALLTGSFPIAWAWHHRSRRRIPPGHCRQCGYDLRATPDRCPECGAS